MLRDLWPAGRQAHRHEPQYWEAATDEPAARGEGLDEAWLVDAVASTHRYLAVV
ncbi:hypothetical protein ACIKQA_19390 [Acinetobacter baumannii]|uniref:hypothetical protein n=1 Tax=Acinetobacter baumannii TaxID=470 RepID=UPI0037D5040E